MECSNLMCRQNSHSSVVHFCQENVLVVKYVFDLIFGIRLCAGNVHIKCTFDFGYVLDYFCWVLKYQNSFDKFMFSRIDIQQCSSVRMSLCVWGQLNCDCVSPCALSGGPAAGQNLLQVCWVKLYKRRILQNAEYWRYWFELNELFSVYFMRFKTLRRKELFKLKITEKSNY